ncbi:MAG: DNA translocase FtsK 4TM domain-containing protein [Candidatus Binatia bacterium]|nr:DNA translocase FtsK 4TM domain-containing protein [Candidatus Binatia bacterium]
MALVGTKPSQRASSDLIDSQYVNEIAGLITIAAALFTLASFTSYHLGLEATWGGVLGNTLARALVRLFGYAVYVIPLGLAVLAVRFFRGGLHDFTLPRLGAWLLVLVLVSGMLGLLDPTGTKGVAGWFGGFLGTLLLNWCGLVGAWLGLTITVLTALSYISGTTPLRLLIRRNPSRPRIRATAAPAPSTEPHARPGWLWRKPEPENEGPIITLPEPEEEAPKRKRQNAQRSLPLVASDEYRLPPISLLEKPASSDRLQLDEELLRRSAEILETKLAHFGIEAQVVAVVPGPVITTFEIQLAPGIKVNRILALQDDLSMALRSPVRIIAPVPGKSVVGIEVANQKRERVYLSEIIGSDAFQEAPSVLTLALGKDSSGTPRVEDLARMPHLLIAGATGTGKSVFLNALIMSILSKASPRDVRFVMIDLKMLELPLYEGLPHQLVPVVTDTKTALVVLNNLCREMDRRYSLLKDKGVRNIDAYNALLAREVDDGVIDLGDEDIAILEEDAEDVVQGSGADSEEWVRSDFQHEHMPKIVVIIDELADLMMTSGRNVEAPIIRLAQKARACGMHLIVATQRPSVDVITGLIKANFPARISFQVASRIDSRTILDSMGAERLLGEGDMLFLQPGRAMERLHGAFVAEKEIHRVVEFAKRQAEPEYAFSLLENTAAEEVSGNLTGEADGVDNDELYDQAVRIVTETRIASISYLQRRLRIGYNRAARLIERMEHEGIVSRSENGRPREVLAPPPPEP